MKFIFNVAIKGFLESIRKKPMVIKYPKYKTELVIFARDIKKKKK